METSTRSSEFFSPWLAAAALIFAGASPCFADGFATGPGGAHNEAAVNNTNKIPEELQGVGIKEHLGEQVSIDTLQFRDESGKPVALSQYFASQKPVLLNLVYFECANLCTFVLNGMVDSLKGLDWTPGKQFEVLSVSINPRDTAQLAAAKKENYVKAYGRPEAASGWHFLTGTEDQIKKLASEVGFGYRYDERDKQYAHAAALFVLTPQGKISRNLYGIDYPAKDLKLALLEASGGRIGTVVERMMLFCYRYDPHTKQYSVYVTNLMKAGAAVTVLVLGAYLALFWLRQRRLRPA